MEIIIQCSGNWNGQTNQWQSKKIVFDVQTFARKNQIIEISKKGIEQLQIYQQNLKTKKF